MRSGKNSESSGLPPEKWPAEAISLKDNRFWHHSFATHLLLNYSVEDSWRLSLKEAGLPYLEVSSPIRHKVKDSIIIGKVMSSLRKGSAGDVDLSAPFHDRLASHLDKLAYLRDLAVGEGLIGQAITAEIARGRVQGFYALDKVSGPSDDGKVAPTEMSDADLIAAVRKLASHSPGAVTFSNDEKSKIIEVTGRDVDFETIERGYRETPESGEREDSSGIDSEGKW